MAMQLCPAARTRAVFPIAALLCLTGCEFDVYRWNQALTLEVDTPAGPVSSTSLQWIEVKEYEKPLFATDTKFEFNGGGGPVILDMGDGNILFGVFEGFQFANSAYRNADLPASTYIYDIYTSDALPDPQLLDFGDEQIRRGISFFRFRDLNDPLSGEFVDITNLSAHFGEGYALKSAVFSITKQKTQESRVEALLPWVSTYEDAIIFDPDAYDYGFSSSGVIVAGFER